jgi:hypothetical protein
MDYMEILEIFAIIGLWIVITRYVLPKFGVPT